MWTFLLSEQCFQHEEKKWQKRQIKVTLKVKINGWKVSKTKKSIVSWNICG
jgi:hypothetical protein